MPTPSSFPTFYLGLDLGQASDFSALVVLETADAAPPRTYAGRHLQRWSLGTPYPTIASESAQLAAHIGRQTGRDVVLAIDATGVGRAVVDLLQREPMRRVQVWPILITGGDTVSRDGTFWHVPKRDLVGVVQVALQTSRLKIASALPEAHTLTGELANFQMKFSAAGHDMYGAWREGTHDDLVLALACALWCGEHLVSKWEPIGT
jgi:hypothetical protein